MRQVFPRVFQANAKFNERFLDWKWVSLQELADLLGVTPRELMIRTIKVSQDQSTGRWTQDCVGLMVTNCTCGSCRGDHFCHPGPNAVYSIDGQTVERSLDFFMQSEIVGNVYVPLGWAEEVCAKHSVGRGFWNTPNSNESAS